MKLKMKAVPVDIKLAGTIRMPINVRIMRMPKSMIVFMTPTIM